METPLLHKQKKVGESSGEQIAYKQTSCRLLASLSFFSVLVILLVSSKQDTRAELVQWVVPKAFQGKSVPVDPKMHYVYVRSGDLNNEDRKTQQVLGLSGSSPSKLSAVCG